jgi:CBS domain-containing protein
MREPTVATVMTRPVITVRPDMPFKEVVATLEDKRISAVAVVDERDHPLGVVSEADALAKQEFRGGNEPAPSLLASRERKARWHKASGCTAANLMTSPAITIGADEPVTAAARRLAEKRVRRLFVVDPGGALVGVVSRRDVLGMFLRDDAEIQAEIEQQVLAEGKWLVPGIVTVRVQAGVATLDGTLEHRSATEIACRLVQAVTGVVGVRSNLGYEFDDTVSIGL